jgi:hypothetical protein
MSSTAYDDAIPGTAANFQMERAVSSFGAGRLQYLYNEDPWIEKRG